MKSCGFGEDVVSTVGSWVVSSSGIMWNVGGLGRGVDECVVIILVVGIS